MQALLDIIVFITSPDFEYSKVVIASKIQLQSAKR